MIIFPGSIFWRMPLFQTLGQSLNRGTTSVDDAVPGIQTCRWSHRDHSFFLFVSANWPQPQPTPPREGQQWCTELAPALSAIALDQLASQLANGSCARKMSLGKSGFPRPTSFHLVPPRSTSFRLLRSLTLQPNTWGMTSQQKSLQISIPIRMWMRMRL